MVYLAYIYSSADSTQIVIIVSVRTNDTVRLVLQQKKTENGMQKTALQHNSSTSPQNVWAWLPESIWFPNVLRIARRIPRYLCKIVIVY